MTGGEVGMKEYIMIREKSQASDIPIYVQDLVRCKDCKHGEPTIINGVWLSVTCGGVDRRPEWFCADGEMRNDDA